MAIRHAFQSGKSDGADATFVQPSNWNAAHTAPPQVIHLIGGLLTWDTMPAAVTEFLGIARAYRLQYDFTDVEQIRIVAQVVVAGASGAALRVQYWTGSAWAYMDGATGPEAAIDVTEEAASSWVSLAAGAQADRVIRIVGINGDEAASPVFGLIALQVK